MQQPQEIGENDINNVLERDSIRMNSIDCSWTTTTGYTLDLSSLYGTILPYSSLLSDDVYYYSPCNDGVICTQLK